MPDHTVAKNRIAIYRDHLLPISNTFVLNQGEALQRFVPYYVGSRLVKGLRTPPDRTIVINSGRLQFSLAEVFFKISGWSPSVVGRLRRVGPALLHAHFGPDGVRAMSLAEALNIPLLVTFHGFDATTKDTFAKRSYYGHRQFVRRRDELKRRARLFIAVSEFIRGKLIDQGFPPDKVIVNYIGVDTEVFVPDSCVKREDIVLFVGRLVANKGCDYLIQAMEIIQRQMPDVELVIIGDGELRQHLERSAKARLTKYRFLGAQPSECVRSWMNRAKVFCVPSIVLESGASEALGMVFLEAQAMGLPVVSFSTGGIPEAVAHGTTGFLVTERDAVALSRHITHLLRDEACWRKFSAAGRERVKSRFSLRHHVNLLEDIYLTVIRETSS